MDEFIRQLLDQKGLPADLDPAVKDQLVQDLSVRAADLINKRIIETLTDDAASQLQQLITSDPNNLEAYQNFITEHVPNQQDIATRALMEFRTLYLGSAA